MLEHYTSKAMLENDARKTMLEHYTSEAMLEKNNTSITETYQYICIDCSAGWGVLTID